MSSYTYYKVVHSSDEVSYFRQDEYEQWKWYHYERVNFSNDKNWVPCNSKFIEYYIDANEKLVLMTDEEVFLWLL